MRRKRTPFSRMARTVARMSWERKATCCAPAPWLKFRYSCTCDLPPLWAGSTIGNLIFPEASSTTLEFMALCLVHTISWCDRWKPSTSL